MTWVQFLHWFRNTKNTTEASHWPRDMSNVLAQGHDKEYWRFMADSGTNKGDIGRGDLRQGTRTQGPQHTHTNSPWRCVCMCVYKHSPLPPPNPHSCICNGNEALVSLSHTTQLHHKLRTCTTHNAGLRRRRWLGEYHASLSPQLAVYSHGLRFIPTAWGLFPRFGWPAGMNVTSSPSGDIRMVHGWVSCWSLALSLTPFPTHHHHHHHNSNFVMSSCESASQAS